jgi:uncharacterized protein
MRILITGGSGLIGRRLSQSLVADGHEVVVLSRSPERVQGLPRGARAERWDGRSGGAWTDLLAGAAVVHLAGESIAEGRWTAEKKRRIRASRVDSSRALAEAVATSSALPAVVLQGSAVGFYGDRGSEELTESSAAGTDFLGEVSRAWEEASAGLDALGVRRPILRTGVVLDPAGGVLEKMVLPFRLFAGGPLGDGRQFLPWIHWQDQIGAIRFLLDHPTATGPFNLTAPHPVSYLEVARQLGRVLHRPSFAPAPAFVLRLVLGEKAVIVLGGQRALPTRLLELGYRFRFTELGDALRDLLR